MKSAHSPVRKRRQLEDVILFTAAGTRFAISAAGVEEIRSLEGLSPFTLGIAHSRFAKVTHTLLRKIASRNGGDGEAQLVFAVDFDIHLGVLPTHHSRVLILRDMPVALLVQGIERMTQIATVISLPLAFRGQERNWYRGLAVIDQHVIPVIEPSSFLNRAEIAVLQDGYKNSQKLVQEVSA